MLGLVLIGSSRGVSLKKALDDIIGLNYETVMAQDINGTPTKEVLFRIKNTTAWQDANFIKKRGFWLLGGTGSNFEEGAEVDFSKIMLHNGKRIKDLFPCL